MALFHVSHPPARLVGVEIFYILGHSGFWTLSQIPLWGALAVPCYNMTKMAAAAAIGNWWLAVSSRQQAHTCITSHTEIFCKTPNQSGDSVPLQPRFGVLWLLVFPKTKITFEREQIQNFDEIQENMMGQLMVIGRTVWGPKVPTLKGPEASLSHVSVPCILHLFQ